MSTANDILDNYQHLIAELRLVPGSKGVFDVNVNGELLFSKYDVDRHAHEGEVLNILTEHIGPDVPKYHDK